MEFTKEHSERIMTEAAFEYWIHECRLVEVNKSLCETAVQLCPENPIDFIEHAAKFTATRRTASVFPILWEEFNRVSASTEHFMRWLSNRAYFGYYASRPLPRD